MWQIPTSGSDPDKHGECHFCIMRWADNDKDDSFC